MSKPAAANTPWLAEAQGLYDRGLFVQAYKRGLLERPLRDWPGAGGLVLAGRLAGNLGATPLAYYLHLKAARRFPQHIEARYFGAFSLLYRRGPWAALRVAPADAELATMEVRDQSNWLSLRAGIATECRDFKTAHRFLDAAFALEQDRAWLWVVKSGLLDQQDRFSEALTAAQTALQINPWYRPAVHWAAAMWHRLGSPHEAQKLLQDACQRLENYDLFLYLAKLQEEAKDFAAAEQSLEHVRIAFPELVPGQHLLLLSRLADVRYKQGDRPRAMELSQASVSGFHQRISENMQREPEGLRRVLEVPFVQQKLDTCVPATLASICAYWGQSVDHEALADEITYDGTPSFRQRAWADGRGWQTREFTLNWEAATALIDRGVPVCVTTVAPGQAHEQAVIGYDACRGTLLIRDPSVPIYQEYLSQPFFETYAGFGPRSLIVLPADQASRLEGVPLADAELYDRLNEMQRALDVHDRTTASQVLVALREAQPHHRITHMARRTLAWYDGDETGVLHATEMLLQLYPDQEVYQLARVSGLRAVGRLAERREALEVVFAKRDANFHFTLALVDELSEDGRERRRAARLLRHVLSTRAADAEAHRRLADLEWNKGNLEVACQLYRMAACGDAKRDWNSQAYFRATRFLKRSDEAIEWLEYRAETWGANSSLPAKMLAEAWCDLDRIDRAFDVYERAMQRRPADTDLQLMAAELYGRYGQLQRAESILAACEQKSSPSAWRRTAASLAGYRGEPALAAEHWRTVVDVERTSVEALDALTHWTARASGEEAAIQLLRASVAVAPHHVGFRRSLVQRLQEGDPQVRLAELKELVALDPVNAWTRREMAAALSTLNRWDDALAESELARELDPRSSWSHSTLATVYEGLHRVDDARGSLREAIRLCIDNTHAQRQLVALAVTAEGRLAELDFIRQEMVAQVNFGDGMQAFAYLAQSILPDEDMMRLLREAHSARPDLYTAWMLLIRQLVATQQMAEARALVDEAASRFPLLPGLWRLDAEVCRAEDRPQQARESLQRALEINPAWTVAALELADLQHHAGDVGSARATLERALKHDPNHSETHAALAGILWEAGALEASLDHSRAAATVDDDCAEAWQQLAQHGPALGEPDLAVQLARENCRRRPYSGAAWFRLAVLLHDGSDTPECLRALDRAIENQPSLDDAHDLRASVLAQDGRVDEAIQACSPSAWGDAAPVILQGRSAWIQYQYRGRAVGIAAMRQVVEKFPDFYWGWLNLAAWLEHEEPLAPYVEAATALVRVAPNEGVSWAHRAQAATRQGDVEAAKGFLERALEVDPHYVYPRDKLLETLASEMQWDRAATLVERFGPKWPADVRWHWEIYANCMLERQAAAAAAWEQLCQVQAANPKLVADSWQRIVDAGWSNAVTTNLDAVPQFPNPNLALAAAWVDRTVHQGRTDLTWGELEKWQDDPERYTASLRSWITANEERARRLAAQGRQHLWSAALHRFVDKHGPQILQDGPALSATISALYDAEMHSRMVRWLGVLQAIPADGAAHVNLAAACATQNYPKMAVRWHRAALNLPQNEHADLSRPIAALDRFAEGKFSLAEALVRQTDRQRIEQLPYYGELYRFAQSFLSVAPPPWGSKSSIPFLRAWLKIQYHMRRQRRDSLYRHLYLRAMKRLAVAHGGILAGAWRIVHWPFV